MVANRAQDPRAARHLQANSPPRPPTPQRRRTGTAVSPLPYQGAISIARSARAPAVADKPAAMRIENDLREGGLLVVDITRPAGGGPGAARRFAASVGLLVLLPPL